MSEDWLTVQKVRNMEDAPLLQNARQALWDVYRILGFDTDGDATPASVPDVERLVVEAAKEMRAESDADYTALSEDLAAALRRLEAAEQSLSSLRAELDEARKNRPPAFVPGIPEYWQVCRDCGGTNPDHPQGGEHCRECPCCHDGPRHRDGTP